MDINIKCAFYLSAEHVSSFSCIFSASFSEIANISECFILANSLSEAVDLIYSGLPKNYDRSFIDSTLLEVKFVKRLDFMQNE